MDTPIKLTNYKHINDDGIGIAWSDFKYPHISPLHSHEFYELELTLRGETEEYINGERYTKKRGAVSILTPADFHSYEVKDEISVAVAMFTEKCVPVGVVSQLFGRNIRRSVVLSEEKTSTLEKLFSVLDSVKDYDNEFKDTLIKRIMESILLIILKAYSAEGHNIKSSKQSDIEKAIQYIDLHFRDNPSVSVVAEVVGKSPDYFSKYFKRNTGYSFSEYLNKRKTECAEALLKISDMSVTEICFNSGFESMSNFLRVFKSLTGTNPTTYRSKIK